MKNYFLALILLATSVCVHANSTQGGQFKNLGPLQVHYIAFPSTFIQPTIAKAYGLERSNYKGIINISVLANKKGNPALNANLTGEARNLLGSKQTLEFKEVIDGDAIYYLAQVDYRNEEVYRFKININQGNTYQVLNFQQKFYVD